MTNHIVNFAIGIDDDAIIRNIQENAYREILKEVKRDALQSIFADKSYWGRNLSFTEDGNIKNPTEIELNNLGRTILKEAIEENKEIIIEKAAELLADSYKRTKAWKEKAIVSNEL